MFGRCPKLDAIAPVQTGRTKRPFKQLERSTSETHIHVHFHIGLVGKSDEFFATAGDLLAKALLQLAKGTCSSHILFNPGDVKTAEEYAKRYGEKEVVVRTRSTSHSTGLCSSRSTSWNESLQKIPILTPDEILRFEQGKCVITNPADRSRGEGSIPYLLKIPIAQAEVNHRTKTESLWKRQVQPALQRRVQLADHQMLTQALYDRIEAAPIAFYPCQSIALKPKAAAWSVLLLFWIIYPCGSIVQV